MKNFLTIHLAALICLVLAVIQIPFWGNVPNLVSSLICFGLAIFNFNISKRR